MPRHTGPKTDLTGAVFGRWTVTGLSDRRSGRQYVWDCRCECGAKRDVVGVTLTGHKSESCGCLHREIVRDQSTVHGGKGRPEYRIWKHMRGRCRNPRDSHFHNYGGRGISVCSRWDDFANFISDMGSRPADNYSIERKDVHGDYEPSNCIWLPMSEQGRNTTKTAFVEYNGERHKLLDLAEKLGVRPGTLHQRARRGTFGFRYA